jgi:hypothetical protein
MKDPDAHADMNEDIPEVPPSTENLPELVKEKHRKDGMDKALDIIDEYYEGVPKPNPNFQHDDDHT